MNENKFSIHNRARSFGFATNGLIQFFKTQHNAWIHAAAAVLVICAGFYFNISAIEWCLIAGCIALVFIAEMFNTAIEWLTNLVSPGYNVQAGLVKDIAAAGVLFSAICSVVIAAIIFIPKINL